MRRTPSGSRPAANSSYRGLGCVREGAAVDEPTIGRTIAEGTLHVVSDAFHKSVNLSVLWLEGIFIKLVKREP
jgi:hypothetical protein